MTRLPVEKMAKTAKRDSSVLLRVETIPLNGRHMIEASAGTGKTFNITRIYLRLLLEKKLRVQNILVVTFTRAATEELRARIGKQLRETLEKWGKRENDDSFFNHLESQVPKATAEILLHEALLDMDEAAIFTIHGFCKRVLSQHAFSSRLPFRLNMEVDTSEVVLEVVYDAYRRWSMDAELYSLIASYWETPEKFLAAFGGLLQKKIKIDSPDYQAIQNDYLTRKKQVYEQFQQQVERYRRVMVTSHKDVKKRTEELDFLLNWLNTKDLSPIPALAKGCYNGSRLRSNIAIEQGIVEMVAPLKALAELSEGIASQVGMAKASALILDSLPALISQIDQAKYSRNMLDFDDLIAKLKMALETDHNEHLTQALVTEYPVALVDEFQDTDGDQYAIFNKLYSPSNESTLFMIGDPKQAIYSFRGGDVFTYLNARSEADYHWFMDTNWRSTRSMVAGYNRLFSGAIARTSVVSSSVFGFGIDYLPVNVSEKIYDALAEDVDFRALQFIHFPVTLDAHARKNKNLSIYKSSFRQVIARWCAAEIERLLSLPIQISLSKKEEEGEEITCRTLKEQDVAILVRDKTEAEAVQVALQERGYSAVYSSGRENVFASEESQYLFRALTGILHLEESRKRIAALSTPLLGLNAKQLYQLKEDELFDNIWRETLAGLRRAWLKKGFLVMAISLLHDFLRPSKERSERMLTNYLHLIELLQVASQRYRQPLELLSWFEQQRGNDFSQEVNQLRLESDANLIRIITQHGSKGLEYPIVFVPFSTRTKISKGTPNFVTYHDRENYQPRVRFAPDKEILGYATKEREAEDIRLLYVAITRAVYRCYICTTQFEKSAISPLGLTLGLSEEEEIFSYLQQLEQDHSSAINVLKVDDNTLHRLNTGQERSTSNTDNLVDIQAKIFQGHIERDWWISSFSMISQQAHAVSRHSTEVLSITGMGRPDRDFAPPPASSESVFAVASTIESLPLRFSIKRGADTGNLLHDAFERVNFRQPDWAQALEIPLKKYSPLSGEALDDLPLWLDECLQSTLLEQEGKILKLAALTSVQTLRETEFYFSVGKTTMTHLADFLTQYRASRSCQHKPVWLPDFRSLEGMMHGFIDLIFEWEGRYYLADYKSTWLGDSLHHYVKPKLEASMEENLYDLQYLIYTVALHRHLAVTVPDYQPENHLGGVFYLYFRGMQPNGDEGVFYTPVDVLWLQKLDLLLKSESEGANE